MWLATITTRNKLASDDNPPGLSNAPPKSLKRIPFLAFMLRQRFDRRDEPRRLIDNYNQRGNPVSLIIGHSSCREENTRGLVKQTLDLNLDQVHAQKLDYAHIYVVLRLSSYVPTIFRSSHPFSK